MASVSSVVISQILVREKKDANNITFGLGSSIITICNIIITTSVVVLVAPFIADFYLRVVVLGVICGTIPLTVVILNNYNERKLD